MLPFLAVQGYILKVEAFKGLFKFSILVCALHSFKEGDKNFVIHVKENVSKAVVSVYRHSHDMPCVIASCSLSRRLSQIHQDHRQSQPVMFGGT